MATTIVERRTVSVSDIVDANTARPLRPSGEAVAALLAAAIGMLTLAFVNQLADMSDAVNAWVHSVGKLWMPGAAGIGPYSGKETLAAAAWIVSWAILHPALRSRELTLSRWLIAFVVMVGVATTFI